MKCGEEKRRVMATGVEIVVESAQSSKFNKAIASKYSKFGVAST